MASRNNLLILVFGDHSQLKLIEKHQYQFIFNFHMKAHITHFTYGFQRDILYMTTKKKHHSQCCKNIYKTKYALAYTFPPLYKGICFFV